MCVWEGKKIRGKKEGINPVAAETTSYQLANLCHYLPKVLSQQKAGSLAYTHTHTHTFSNLSLMGFGLSAVTLSQISLPILKASSLEAPFSNTNTLRQGTIEQF